MAIIRISDVVEVLIKSGHLLQHLLRFSATLGTSADTEAKLKSQLNSFAISHYTFLVEVIGEWVEREGTSATVESLVIILKEMDCNNLAEQLMQTFPQETALQCCNQTKPTAISTFYHKAVKHFWEESRAEPFYNCGEPYHWFAGRWEELGRLRRFLELPKPPNLIIISGLAGIGKTELAKRFCHELCQEGKAKLHFLWLLAENGLILRQELQKVAKSLGLAMRKGDESIDIFQNIIQNLPKLPTIIVFDNLDFQNAEVDEILSWFLTAKESLFFIVTTRNITMLQEHNPNIIQVDNLPLETAISFVSKALNLDTSIIQVYKEIAQLCEDVQCYTLALRQAVAFIKKQRLISTKGKCFSVSDYIQKLKSNEKLELLSMENFDHKYKKSTMKTMSVTFEHIMATETGGAVAAFLRLLSYLPPENVRVKYMEKMFKYFIAKLNIYTSEDTVEKSIQSLKSFHLMKCENEKISVHRMVQEVTRSFFKIEFWNDMNIVFQQESEFNFVWRCQGNNLVADTFANFIALLVITSYKENGFSDFLCKNWHAFLKQIPSHPHSQLFYKTLVGFLSKVRDSFGSACHPNLVRIVFHSLPEEHNAEFAILCDELWKECFLFNDILYLRAFTKNISYVRLGGRVNVNKNCDANISEEIIEGNVMQLFAGYFYHAANFDYSISSNDCKYELVWDNEFLYFDKIARQIGGWFWTRGKFKDCLRWKQRRYELAKHRFFHFKTDPSAGFLSEYLFVLLNLGKTEKAKHICHKDKDFWMVVGFWQFFGEMFSLRIIGKMNDMSVLGINFQDLFQNCVISMRRIQVLDYIAVRLVVAGLESLLESFLQQLTIIIDFGLWNELISVVEIMKDNVLSVGPMNSRFNRLLEIMRGSN